MKKLLFILILPLFLFGQTAKYFLPIPVTTSSGKGINYSTGSSEKIAIYPAGTTTGGDTLTWLPGSAGRYYWTDTTAITVGEYDVYMISSAGTRYLYASNVSINYGNSVGTLINDSRVHKAMFGNTSLTGLDSVGVYEHITSMKVYNVKDYGAYSDSTNAASTRDAIQACINAAWASSPNGAVFFPPGVYAVDSSVFCYPLYYYGIPGKSKIVQTQQGDSVRTVFTAYEYAGHIDNTETIYFKDLIIEGQGGYDPDYPGCGWATGGIDVNYGGGSTWLKNAVFDHITVKNINCEMLQSKRVYNSYFWNCYCENGSFDAYNPAETKYCEIINCTAKDVKYGIEAYVKDRDVAAADEDLSSIIIDNFNGINLYNDGIFVLGGNNWKILNSKLSFYDTSYVVTSHNSGIVVACDYNRINELLIQNVTIDSAITYGINLKNATYIPDYTVIDNVNIKNSNRSGILIQYSTGTGEGNVEIKNSRIINFNRSNYDHVLGNGIYIGTDKVNVHHNTVYLSDTTGTGLSRGYDPVFIYQNKDSVTVEYNNFISPDGRQNKIGLYSSINMGDYFISNNKGLGTFNAIKSLSGDTYYQLNENKIDGYYISEYKGEKQFAFKIINNDSLCIVEYASDGSISDTSSALKVGFDEGILNDYSFESWANSTNLYQYVENGVGSGDIIAQCDTAYKGSYSVKNTYGNDGCVLTQQVSVDSNSTYQMRFYTKGDGTVSGRWRIYDSTNSLDIVGTVSTGIDTTTWILVDSTFAVSDSTHLINVYFYSPSTTGSAYFDTARLIKQ